MSAVVAPNTDRLAQATTARVFVGFTGTNVAVDGPRRGLRPAAARRILRSEGVTVRCFLSWGAWESLKQFLTWNHTTGETELRQLLRQNIEAIRAEPNQ